MAGDLTFDYMQVKETLLQKFIEVEQTAKEQATDNAILDQLHKVFSVLCWKALVFLEISDETSIQYCILWYLFFTVIYCSDI